MLCAIASLAAVLIGFLSVALGVIPAHHDSGFLKTTHTPITTAHFLQHISNQMALLPLLPLPSQLQLETFLVPKHLKHT